MIFISYKARTRFEEVRVLAIENSEGFWSRDAWTMKVVVVKQEVPIEVGTECANN
jgi:hypothetical protein